MTSGTGIEVSAVACRAVRARLGPAGLRLRAFGSTACRADDPADVERALRQIVTTRRFGRRARVVVWGVRSLHRLVPLPPGSGRHWKARALDVVAAELFAIPWTRNAHLALTRQRVRDASGVQRDIVRVSVTSRADLAARLEPVARAGFTVLRVTTPALALAALAADKGSGVFFDWAGGRKRLPTPSNATAYLALSRHAGALAVVRESTLLLAREWRWTDPARLKPGTTTKIGEAEDPSERAQLLDRYVFVTKLGPELRPAFAEIQATYGIPVERVVTCGDLPDLRSLTIPLIEELDLEVDVLDSPGDLDMAVLPGSLEAFEEQIAAFRLACAVAVRQPFDIRSSRFRPVLGRLGWFRGEDLRSRAAL